MKVFIVNYGLGNLRSVAGAVEHSGHSALVSDDPRLLPTADKIILPGVGAYGDGMQNLREKGWTEALSEAVLQKQRPILGICLGAQLLTEESDEFGSHRGLGWVPAQVRKIEPGAQALRVPHMGWNDMFVRRPTPLFAELPENALFYYVHSHSIRTAEESIILGECDYGGCFVSVFAKDNIFGTQFHPEKSQLAGLQLLKNFLEKV